MAGTIMKFVITRESILQPLQKVSGVVERKQTLPILSHVLLRVNHSTLTLMGTDMEVELSSHVLLEGQFIQGETTVSGRKLLDICRSFASHAEITFVLEKQQLVLTSGRGKYVLATLPANEFPSAEEEKPLAECEIESTVLKRLLEHTYFAMAQQDVRYYLNGVLWEFSEDKFVVVATDGHRLAFSSNLIKQNINKKTRVIVPRKTITELMRLLDKESESLTLTFSDNHLKIIGENFQLISKLIDSSFPDYRRLLPQRGDKVCSINRDNFRQVLNRVAILCHEQLHSARLTFAENCVKVSSYNPEQDAAEEELEAQYQGEGVSLGVNIHYLLDCLNVINQENIKMTLVNTEEPLLIEGVEDDGSLYVIMPVKL